MHDKEEVKREHDKIVAGLEETYRRLVEFKKQKNSPLVVMRNGEIVELDPHDVPPTTTYKRGSSSS